LILQYPFWSIFGRFWPIFDTTVSVSAIFFDRMVLFVYDGIENLAWVIEGSERDTNFGGEDRFAGY
jgi:hypothetical protein